MSHEYFDNFNLLCAGAKKMQVIHFDLPKQGMPQMARRTHLVKVLSRSSESLACIT